MRWNEVKKKLKKIGYKEGERATHFTVWNCPCTKKEDSHPVGVGLHGTEECRFHGLKRQLGPHAKDFGA